jgi:hypothetical protein
LGYDLIESFYIQNLVDIVGEFGTEFVCRIKGRAKYEHKSYIIDKSGQNRREVKLPYDEIRRSEGYSKRTSCHFEVFFSTAYVVILFKYQLDAQKIRQVSERSLTILFRHYIYNIKIAGWSFQLSFMRRLYASSYTDQRSLTHVAAVGRIVSKWNHNGDFLILAPTSRDKMAFLTFRANSNFMRFALYDLGKVPPIGAEVINSNMLAIPNDSGKTKGVYLILKSCHSYKSKNVKLLRLLDIDITYHLFMDKGKLTAWPKWRSGVMKVRVYRGVYPLL